uniref:Superoxide dismutase copper/zinc binding domain-containing protein n=1 Tax=Oncorhynchus tshawytscha TaxID=74940 RepID=A0A8C8LQQ6_ONCTS
MNRKEVSALVNMRGVKGYFLFRQDSPFEVTKLRVNLTNLGSRVGPYHIHHFPTPPMRSPPQTTCSNDNVGGHWNPFGMDTKDPTYPSGPGSTHDRYEVGDLSARHGSLKGKAVMEAVFTDFNLPLFGQNSIVGRSVVIHQRERERLGEGETETERERENVSFVMGPYSHSSLQEGYKQPNQKYTRGKIVTGGV